MNDLQVQGLRMIHDRINDTQRTMLLLFFQGLIDFDENEVVRNFFFQQIASLLNNLDLPMVTDFLEVVRGLSPHAIAEARIFLRDGFPVEIDINDDEEDDDNGNDDDDNNEDVHSDENDADLISEMSLVLDTMSLDSLSLGSDSPPGANETFHPESAFDP